MASTRFPSKMSGARGTDWNASHSCLHIRPLLQCMSSQMARLGRADYHWICPFIGVKRSTGRICALAAGLTLRSLAMRRVVVANRRPSRAGPSLSTLRERRYVERPRFVQGAEQIARVRWSASVFWAVARTEKSRGDGTTISDAIRILALPSAYRAPAGDSQPARRAARRRCFRATSSSTSTRVGMRSTRRPESSG